MYLKMTTFVMIACFFGTGCKEQKPAETPSPKKPATQTTGDEVPQETPTDADVTAADLVISPDGASGPEFQATTGTAWTKTFSVSGDNGHNIVVALYETDEALSLTGTTSSKPELRLDDPKVGTISFKFLLRDLDACRATEANQSDCDIDQSDYGSLTKKSYDRLSERFVVKTTQGGSTDLSSDNSTPGSGNNQLIDQILANLGGSGGGNGLGDLTQLLQGFDTSQLQQILQGQSNGLDIQTILKLLQGL